MIGFERYKDLSPGSQPAQFVRPHLPRAPAARLVGDVVLWGNAKSETK